jgi:K+-sensing histidine kinase KdpD
VFFSVTRFEDALLLGMYFVVALALRQITARTRAQEKAKRQSKERAKALYLLTRETGRSNESRRNADQGCPTNE